MCSGFDLHIEESNNMLSGRVANDSLIIIVLLSKSTAPVTIKDVLDNGDIVGRFGYGERWSYRTDGYSESDGTLYVLGVSLLHSCTSSIYQFKPSAANSTRGYRTSLCS